MTLHIYFTIYSIPPAISEEIPIILNYRIPQLSLTLHVFCIHGTRDISFFIGYYLFTHPL